LTRWKGGGKVLSLRGGKIGRKEKKGDYLDSSKNKRSKSIKGD